MWKATIVNFKTAYWIRSLRQEDIRSICANSSIKQGSVMTECWLEDKRTLWLQAAVWDGWTLTNSAVPQRNTITTFFKNRFQKLGMSSINNTWLITRSFEVAKIKTYNIFINQWGKYGFNKYRKYNAMHNISKNYKHTCLVYCVSWCKNPTARTSLRVGLYM